MSFSGGGGDGKSAVDWRFGFNLFCKAKGRFARLSFPGLGGARGPVESSLEGELLELDVNDGLGLNLLTKFLRDSWYSTEALYFALELR